jgi:GNAT superfamily N-acetyltransferase
VFARHHYLDHKHNNAARVFLAYVNGTLAGMISVFHFPHPKFKTMKKVHRLVVLPDFQGIGIGIKLLNEVGKAYKRDGWRYNITTSAPSLIYALKKNNLWRCCNIGRVKRQKKNTGNPISTRKSSSENRLTATFEMIWKP